MVTDYKKTGLSPGPPKKMSIGEAMKPYTDPNRMPPGDPSISKLPAWKALPIPKRDRPITERPKNLPMAKTEDRRNWPNPMSGLQSPKNYRTVKDPVDHSTTLIRKGSRYEKPYKDTRKAVKRQAQEQISNPRAARMLSESVATDVVGDLAKSVAAVTQTRAK